MAELPESWGLKAKANDKGTLDIIGKDDSGKEYKVRTTDQPYVSDTDVRELHEADRESYKNLDSGAREYVHKLTDYSKRKNEERDRVFEEDLAETAERLVRETTENGMASSPTLIDVPLKVGLSQAYERGERYFRWKQQVFGES